MDLTEEQIERYSRQIVLKEIGGIGQNKLLNSKVTIVGAGGLGSPVAYYLTAAGIGNIISLNDSSKYYKVKYKYLNSDKVEEVELPNNDW